MASQKKIAEMTDAELAMLAAAAPEGFTAVFYPDGNGSVKTGGADHRRPRTLGR